MSKQIKAYLDISNPYYPFRYFILQQIILLTKILSVYCTSDKVKMFKGTAFISFLFCITTISLLSITQVSSKNVVNLETFKDSNGKLHKRLLPGNNILENTNLNEGNPTLSKRSLNKKPFNLNDIFSPTSSHQDTGRETSEFHIVALDSKLPLFKEIELFASYIRNDPETYTKLSDSNQDLIIIAPTNNAIVNLSLKPWQFPRDISKLEDEKASELDIDLAIDENISQFVRSHIVAYDDNRSNILETPKKGEVLLKSVNGNEILLKRNEVGSLENDFCIASTRDNIYHPVERIITSENGVILIIDSCLEWPDDTA
ncbi:uncharacterized protein NDAI_0H00870 [Naumovozyma dairenensis CBS 421]|uniref:FAS1 domain-containing protein n=1 Tax=Naumovozyma dairenensis (strain ATCC 10597 / BCRC 20456 / CBS 421 / NBRC 0211 / NRRL Y-12639) TaxID=1071378 RepID=G0WEQ0_NAUDC|nr:hypothetical protein NDAI_0H00870 [Naumovozyma dairenensis CBS 421]CCD26261.1 hypothetical protein NDAI_0H00870 [Naumovozyma dairenensis CBS 421]